MQDFSLRSLGFSDAFVFREKWVGLQVLYLIKYDIASKFK